MSELEEAIKLFGREDLLGEYGIQDTDTNIEVFMSIKDMVKYYRQDLEIERLNNIINELEKELIDCIKEAKLKWRNQLTDKGYLDIQMTVKNYEDILNKLQELKGVDKE